MIFAPDLGASARPKLRLQMEKDAIDPPSVNHTIDANTMSTLDLSPQSPSITDSNVVMVGPISQGPTFQCTGDHPPHPSHFRYDMA
jgi:hypothetical protein